MKMNFQEQAKVLYEQALDLVSSFRKKQTGEGQDIPISNEFRDSFFQLTDQVNVSLMEERENFYGYFLFQMKREIRFDLSYPTGVNFKGSTYVIYFNPLLFLPLSLRQMESTIKHEILHILSLHLIRAKDEKKNYHTLALNMAMDIVVNHFLDQLPPYATTLEAVNRDYSLHLLPYETFEYYAEQLEAAIEVDRKEKNQTEETASKDSIASEYDPEQAHDIWEESSEIEEKTLVEFTEKILQEAQKGELPSYLDALVKALHSSQGELPWNLYLKRLMGMVESKKKKTITRRNRRQPERLDLRGELRGHKAKLMVALDISGSISEEEFNQAMKEVLSIVNNYQHEIILVECDSEIRRVYPIKTKKEIKSRLYTRGGTKFSPVFEYANRQKINLLVYFTDGKGETKLQTIPKGYKILWVLSGRGETLSLAEPYGAVKKLHPIEIKEYIPDLHDYIRDGYSMNNPERIPDNG